MFLVEAVFHLSDQVDHRRRVEGLLNVPAFCVEIVSQGAGGGQGFDLLWVTVYDEPDLVVVQEIGLLHREGVYLNGVGVGQEESIEQLDSLKKFVLAGHWLAKEEAWVFGGGHQRRTVLVHSLVIVY